MMRAINHIVLHCTATRPEATVESIQNHWRKKLKWKSPGYHYLIEADGTVHTLQSEDKQTNGVRGHNEDSIHVSYIGGIDENAKPKDTRTDEQNEALAGLIRSLMAKYPNADVKGHRDFSPDKNGNGVIDFWERIKECPSFDVSNWLSTLGI